MKKRSPNRVEKSLRVLVALAVVLALGAAIAFSMPAFAKEVPKQIRFLGRFHILALHVPIGILVLTLLAEGATLFRRGRRMGDVVVGFALTMLVFSGVAAVLLGLLLADGGHYPHKLVAPHRNLTILGLWFAGMARLVWARRQSSRLLLRLLLVCAAASMSIGAHFGGSMTHGEDYLWAPIDDKPAPIVEEPEAGAPVLVADAGAQLATPVDAGIADASTSDAGDAGVDAGPPKPTSRQLAQGVVNRKCSPCHTTNSKGGLRMTDVAHPTKRGVLKPGNPEGSLMYTNLLLAKEEDDHMPPDGEPQLTKGEIAIIRAFILEQK